MGLCQDYAEHCILSSDSGCQNWGWVGGGAGGQRAHFDHDANELIFLSLSLLHGCVICVFNVTPQTLVVVYF